MGTIEFQAQETCEEPRNAGPILVEPEMLPPAESGCKPRQRRENEEDVVAVLNPTLRVTRADVQWILKTRAAAAWRNIAFCGTKEGLLLGIKTHLQAVSREKTTLPLETLVARYCDSAAWALVEALPDFFPKTPNE